uniref:PDZ and LIM domain 7 n=1 Tax=Nothobranchius furzeri TaxID=105023 RepID=A0A8C6KC84_NOTFU
MTHVEAQNKIRAATDSLTLTLSRAPKEADGKDSLSASSVQPKYFFVPSTTINNMARPFAAGGTSANSGPIIKPVAYAPKLNVASSQGRASTLQPQNGGEATYYDDIYLQSKHGLRGDSVPCFIPNDRSKKRLIEDTEDWQPRTGTTQSRSFRILAQLTGTDFMQDPDDENMKKSREKFLTEIQSPRYARLRDWHHDRSARALNIKV